MTKLTKLITPQICKPYDKKLYDYANGIITSNVPYEVLGCVFETPVLNVPFVSRCDLCRDLIWGLYDTGGTRCTLCDLTCHEKCRQEIRLNCTSYERGLTLVKSSSRRNSSSSSSSSSTDLKTDNDETLANISTIRYFFFHF